MTRHPNATIEKQNNMVINKYTGTIKIKYAKRCGKGGKK